MNDVASHLVDELPTDWLTYGVFFVCGIAILTPWNALLSAADYFQARYANDAVTRLLTICYLPPTLVLMVALLGRHERAAPRARLLGGLLAFTALMVVVAALEAAGGRGTPVGGLLAVAGLVGTVDGLAQSALYGEVSLLPPRYTQAVCSGTAASGAAVSLLRILTKATLPDPTPGGGGRAATTAFFGLAAATCGAATVLYGMALPRAAAAKVLARGHEEARLANVRSRAAAAPAGRGCGGAASDPSAVGSGTELTGAGRGAGGKAQAPDAVAERAGSTPLLPAGSKPLLTPTAAAPDETPPTPSLHPAPCRRRVARHVWPLVVGLAAIYTVTLSIFPGVIIDVFLRNKLSSWYPIIVIFGFNVADFMGKTAPGVAWVAARTPGRVALMVAALARVLFIPALIGIKHVPHSGAVVAVLIFALGLSNGYVTACSQMRAVDGLYGRDAEDAGTAGVLALVVGLCAGSALSFLWLL